MKITDLKNYTVLGSTPQTTTPQAAVASPSISDNIFGAAQGVSDFIGAKGLTDLAGSQIAKLGLASTGNMNAANRVEQPSFKNVAGSAIQTGANFLPGAGMGAGLATKIGVGAATGYAFDVGSKLQNNNVPLPDAFTPGVGTAVGAALPVAGAGLRVANRVVGRLVKGLASGLSGVSTEAIDRIVTNPDRALEVSNNIAKSGNNRVLENNARQIVNGVSKIRQEARTAFGEGVSALKAEDINPQTFRQSMQTFLDANKISVSGATRNLDGVEFSDPKNLQKASNLIEDLSKVKLDGYSLRSLLNKIEGSRFKTAVGDEKLAFNAFIKDLGSSVKEAITGSTDKLGEINKAYSSDMQLVEAMQNIFGKVNFKNLPEVVKASQKLDTLFSQKGLAPEVVDNFLNRIGVNPNDFKTGEAVRQIMSKASGANSKGLSVGEIMQQATGALVTPQMVKNLAITAGMAEQKLLPILRALSDPARKVLIQGLLQASQEGSK